MKCKRKLCLHCEDYVSRSTPCNHKNRFFIVLFFFMSFYLVLNSANYIAIVLFFSTQNAIYLCKVLLPLLFTNAQCYLLAHSAIHVHTVLFYVRTVLFVYLQHYLYTCSAIYLLCAYSAAYVRIMLFICLQYYYMSYTRRVQYMSLQCYLYMYAWFLTAKSAFLCVKCYLRAGSDIRSFYKNSNIFSAKAFFYK